MSVLNASEYSDAIFVQYERRLLTRALPRLIHNRFGAQARVNRGLGSLQFRKYAGLSAISSALSSGVTPVENIAPALSSVSVTPLWYGAWLGYTDKIDMIGFDPIVLEASGILGEQAGLSIDTLTRDVLVAGATDDFANGAASRALLDSGDKIGYVDFLIQIAELEAANARPLANGRYAVILHPYSWATLMQDPTFVTLFTREAGGASNPLRSGIVGTILNCDVYVSSNAASYTSAGVGSAFTAYSALFIGAEAYGSYGIADLTPNVNVDGGGVEVKNMTGQSVKPVSIIVKELGSAGTSDPLNQRGTIAWKLTHIAAILNSAWIRDLEHLNDFSA
jgi:N4-gp56 family major capsid protein